MFVFAFGPAYAVDVPAPEVPAAEPSPEHPAPQPSPEPAPKVRSDRDGYTWMLTTGIVSGGYVGAAITAGAAGTWESEEIVGGSLLGAGLGAATVVVLRPDAGYTVDGAALVATGATVGAWGGHMLARTVIPPGAEGEVGRTAIAGGLGNVAGTGLALAFAQKSPPAGVLVRADLAALVGWQAAAGGMDLAGLDPDANRQARHGLGLAAGLGAGAGSLALSSATSGKGPNGGLLGLALAQGAWVGVWSPIVFVDGEVDERHVLGGLRLGVGAGYLAALALAPIAQPDSTSTSLQGAGIVAGNALGAGVPIALGVDVGNGRNIVAPMLIGGAVGQVYGGLLAPSYSFDPGQTAVASTLGLWTAWQAVGFGAYGAHVNPDADQAIGYGLVAGGAGTVAAMAVTPFLDVTPEGAALAASGGVWGTWYAGWIGSLANLNPEAHWLVTLGAGNAGLVGTFVGVAGREPSWTQVALIDGLGAAGGAGGALLGVVASSDGDVVGGCSLAGSTVGLALGVWQASKVDDDRSASLRVPGLGAVPMPTAQPWTDSEGNAGVWVGVRRDRW